MAPKKDDDFQTILDLLGIVDEPKKPKPVEPQPKRPTYLEHLLETEDSTDKAHVVMSTELVEKYLEYDRAPGGKDYTGDYRDVVEAVKQHGGIRQPLWISTDGKTAMLVEGNNRVAVAKELGIQELPVRVTFDKKTMRNEGADPVPLDPALRKWVRENRIEGRFGSDAFDVPELKQYIGMPDEMINLFHQTDPGTAAKIVASQHLRGRGGPEKGGKYRASTEARRPGWGPEFPVYFTDSPGNSYGKAGVSVRVPVNSAFLDYIDKDTGRRSYAVSQRDLEGVRIVPFNPKPVPGPDSGGALVGKGVDDRIRPRRGETRSRQSRSYANPAYREYLTNRAGFTLGFDEGYLNAVEQVNHRVTEFVRAAYRLNPKFLTNHEEIDRITALMAPAVTAGQLQVANLTNAHLAELFGLDNVPTPDPKLLQRNGIDLDAELARPFWTAVKAAREGKSFDEALAAGEHRMEKLLQTDIQRAKVVQSREALKANGVSTYSRVAGPKACWLCSIAATQVYYTEDLLPVHPGCRCSVAPIPPGGQDSLDTRLDPEYVLSKDASQVKLMTSVVESGAAPAEYRELIAVREHSEVGPQLTWAHQNFTGPKDLPVPPSKEVLAQQAYDAVKANGGVTIDLAGNTPTDGYAYAPYKTTEFKVPLAEFTPKHIDDYVDSHHRQLSRPGNNLGMWVQDGYVYLDVSKVGPPTVETFAKAQAADQLAVFDLGNFNEIQLGTIDSEGYHSLGTPTDLHRQYREQVARADQGRGAAGVPEVPVGAGGSARVATGELEWTGPPVADRTSNSVFNDYVETHWSARKFDDYVDSLRAGGRDVQQSGYAGAAKEAKSLGLNWLDITSGEDVGKGKFQSMLRLEGREIVSRAVHSDLTKYSLYRGMEVPRQLAEGLKPGQEISMPLSSFFFERQGATEFSQKAGRGWRSRRAVDGGDPILFELEKGARTAQLADEEVAFGKFEIVSTRRMSMSEYQKDARTIGNLEMLRDPRPPMVVTIRQTSMIEDGVDTHGGALRKGKGATRTDSDEPIPEFAFVGGKTPGRISPVPDSMHTVEGEKLWPDGLKVAQASRRDDVKTMIADHWASLEFDDLKYTIRSGVKSVQTLGYSGLKEEQKFVDLKDELTRYQKFGINAGPEGPSEEMLFLEGQEIAARAIHSKPTTEKLYRGMGIKASDIEALQPGDELSLPASSFSEHPQAAEAFAQGKLGWKSRDFPKDSKPVVVQLEKGAKVADVSTWSMREKVGFGRFEVVRVDPVAHIDWNGEFAPGKAPESRSGIEWPEYTLVTVRQTSLIEAPDNAAKAKGDKKTRIPEYTIIKKPVLTDGGYEDIGGAHFYSQSVDKRTQQGIRDGLTDFHARHPEVKISTVSIEYDRWDDNMLARAVPSVSKDPNVQGWETRIELNPKFFGEGTYEDLEEAVRKSSRTRWSVPVPEDISAAHAVIAHEGGHGLDAAGFEQTRKEVNQILMDEFHRLHPEFDMRNVYAEAEKSGITSWVTADGTRHHMTYEEFAADSAQVKSVEEAAARAYRKFLQDNMSEYSFEDGARNARFLRVRPGEALAEASADVDTNGDKASITSKVLQRRMKENAKASASLSDTEYMKRRGGLSTKSPAEAVVAKEKARAAKEAEKARKEAEKAAKAAEREAKRAAAQAKKAEAAAIKAKKEEQGFGDVRKRIEHGTEIQPIRTARGTLDKKATWDSVSDETLRENWRAALRDSDKFAWESGKVWYGDLNQLCTNLSTTYGAAFRANWGVELTPDLVAGIMSSYSTNNGWAMNLVGVEQFLSGTAKLNKLGEPTAMHFQNKDWGVKPLLNYLRSGKGTVVDYYAENLSAPKPYNFLKSIKGDKDAACVDRWVSRIMLHTNDYKFADDMWGAESKDGGRYGFQRMRQAILDVASEPEFAGYDPYMLQAIPWVHVNGGDLAVANLDVGELFTAAKAEHSATEVTKLLNKESHRRGWS